MGAAVQQLLGKRTDNNIGTDVALSQLVNPPRPQFETDLEGPVWRRVECFAYGVLIDGPFPDGVEGKACMHDRLEPEEVGSEQVAGPPRRDLSGAALQERPRSSYRQIRSHQADPHGRGMRWAKAQAVGTVLGETFLDRGGRPGTELDKRLFQVPDAKGHRRSPSASPSETPGGSASIEERASSASSTSSPSRSKSSSSLCSSDP